MSVGLDNRVSHLEKVLENYIVSTGEALASLSHEMKDFKDEMKDFKEESRADRRNMNKQWGHLANKMGTIVEDIIRPGIRPALKTYFHSDPVFIGNHIHRKVKKTGLEGEFDIVAMDENQIYLVEVKSSPGKTEIKKLATRTIPRFRQLFPEFESYPVIPIFGSLSFTDGLISYASESGIYLMGYREWDYLDILNFAEVNSPN